jgi:hypothetical protein
MSLPNINDKKYSFNPTFLGVIVIAVISLVAALYKINRAEERFETKKSITLQNESIQREKFVDKYANDYAEGAAWALKNEIADPEACDEQGVSSIENLGCMAAAVEVREKMEREVSRGMLLSETEDALDPEPLSPEDAMYSEAYIEPEIN